MYYGHGAKIKFSETHKNAQAIWTYFNENISIVSWLLMQKSSQLSYCFWSHLIKHSCVNALISGSECHSTQVFYTNRQCHSLSSLFQLKNLSYISKEFVIQKLYFYLKNKRKIWTQILLEFLHLLGLAAPNRWNIQKMRVQSR